MISETIQKHLVCALKPLAPRPGSYLSPTCHPAFKQLNYELKGLLTPSQPWAGTVDRQPPNLPATKMLHCQRVFVYSPRHE